MSCLGLRKDMSHKNPPPAERRRTVRIKRSGLQTFMLEGLDRPAMKFAETREELEQAFSLVYEVYRKKNFIPNPVPHKMLYNMYSLLPSTKHIIAKSYLTVISNLTEIFDTPQFGLPMDAIYKPELDNLRDKGRSLVELSALATPREHRWKNIFLYLVQLMYWHSVYNGVDDVCITINPRHVRYYMQLFPFEQLGPERHYKRVSAPAIALRGKVKDSMDRMVEICHNLGFDTPLYSYFYRITGITPANDAAYLDSQALQVNVRPKPIKTSIVKYFLNKDKSILNELSDEQKDELQKVYPDLVLEDSSK